MLKILMPLIIQGLDRVKEVFFFSSFRSCTGRGEIRFKMALKCGGDSSFKVFSAAVLSHYETLTNAHGSTGHIDYSTRELVGNAPFLLKL